MEQVLRDETPARAFVEGLTNAAGMLRLEALSAALINENQRQNLISRPSEDQMWVRHIADSAQLLRFVPRETPSRPWLDLGTGAGFPGLVIAALRPEWKIVLVESRARRTEWL